MKLLIDECLPRSLKRYFGNHECGTVQEMGWSGQKNGALLALAEDKFHVLVTMDQGIQYQQQLATRKIAVLVFSARSNQLEDLAPLIPAALEALGTVLPGRVVRVGA
jgi:predicted nuclease of predicted toxin-antitoxin system